MLVVTDNGVQVLLKQKSTLKIVWRDTLCLIVLCGINVLLCFGLHLYSRNVAIIINVFLLILSFSLQGYRKRNQSVVLSGGDLLLSPHAFKHTFIGKTTEYQLAQNDKIETQNNCIKIRNAHNKILYQIDGFIEPKQIEVAQAVLQGKTIQTQGKAIRMQSN